MVKNVIISLDDIWVPERHFRELLELGESHDVLVAGACHEPIKERQCIIPNVKMI
jgi:hypothetical protein